MKTAKTPENELVRLNALQELRILDTPGEARFDRLTRLAQSLFKVEVVLISLVDKDRQWFKSCQGVDVQETHRDHSFCAHAIHHDSIMQVQDARQDSRFHDNPLVIGPPHIRFYAGAPLHAHPDESRVGTLCLIDSRTRLLSEQELLELRDLADAVEAELNRVSERQLLKQVSDNEQQVSKLLDSLPDLIFVLDRNGGILNVNQHPELPNRREALIGKPIRNFLPSDIVDRTLQITGEVLSDSTPRQLDYTLSSDDGLQHYRARLSPFEDETVLAVCRNVTESKQQSTALRKTTDRLKSIIEGTNVGTWEWNVQTGETVFNERWAEMVGYKLDELAPISIETWMSLAHPDDLRASEQALTRHFSGQCDFYDVECRMRHKDGYWIWVQDRGKVVSWDGQGTPLWMAGTHADVTQNRLLRDELAAQKQLLEQIFDSDITAITVLNEQGELIYANRSAQKVLGLVVKTSENDTVTFDDPLWDIESLDGSPFPVQNLPFSQVRATGKAVSNIRHAIVWPDGTRKCLSIDGAPLATAPDSEQQYAFAVQDITKEIENQASLNHQLKAFETLNTITAALALDHTAQMQRLLLMGSTFLGLENGIISRVEDDQLEVLHSLSAGEVDKLAGQISPLKGTLCAETFAHDSVTIATDTGSRSTASDVTAIIRHPATYIGISLSLNGARIGTLSFSSATPRKSPFQDSDQQFINLLGRWLSAALTRQQTIRDLQLSESRFRALFELSPIGIALNDFESGRFLDLNDALLKPTGYSREEFTQLDYYSVTPIEYLPDEKRMRESMMQTGRYGPFEKEYIRKDGTRYPVLLNGVLTEDSNGRQLIWSIIEDISERKRIEQLKNQFISTVSHELRTPLTSIAGSLKLMSGGVAGEIPETARQMLQIAIQNSERLSLLINDLLDMERLASGRISMNLKPQALVPIIELTLAQLQSYADQHQVILVFQSPPALSPWARVDEQRFAQVMVNLLSNAVKFSHPGHSVTVNIAEHPDLVEIAVTDTGTGIPESFMPQLFEQFTQADASDQRSRTGTGLGLAICKALVEQMGGSIRVESTLGEGSTFTISLPSLANDNRSNV